MAPRHLLLCGALSCSALALGCHSPEERWTRRQARLAEEQAELDWRQVETTARLQRQQDEQRAALKADQTVDQLTFDLRRVEAMADQLAQKSGETPAQLKARQRAVTALEVRAARALEQLERLDARVIELKTEAELYERYTELSVAPDFERLGRLRGSALEAIDRLRQRAGKAAPERSCDQALSSYRHGVDEVGSQLEHSTVAHR